MREEGEVDAAVEERTGKKQGLNRARAEVVEDEKVGKESTEQMNRGNWRKGTAGKDCED